MKLQYFHLAYAAAALIVLYVMEPMGLCALCFDVMRGVYRRCVENISLLRRHVRKRHTGEENVWSY